ncbi:Cryptochrome-1 [Polyplax serrata]|uniref:Cryptochrome-1 n=1 Tax=Polyplax serrata TaxID=468196 RepID=A0AAN8SD31_POLSC
MKKVTIEGGDEIRLCANLKFRIVSFRFLLQCLEDLDRSLRKLNSRLFVIRGQPADALPKLFKEWGTTNLTFEEDPEPFGRVRDLNIMAMCKELGISVVSKASHTLYKLEHIIEKNGGNPPLTYHQFQTIIANIGPPPKPEETVTGSLLEGSHTPVSDDHDIKYGVPTLEELGFETDKLKPAVWCGGESEALARLERHLERKAWVASFGHPKMTPQSLLASQTGLSPYLRFGCLSTRLFYYELVELYKKIKKAMPPLSLHGQLLWREFFYCAATKNPNFDKMNGNPICVQIPWDENAQALAKWANGQTGFPWIDAIMTQLREEGWIHHLARHAVACFLTRGDLWISWEEGMKVFDELLLDADWSVNAGMWMWLSCSSFFQQFFHCYCPIRFGRKADPNGDYIRKYLPVLKNFPTKYIHEPWLAPEAEQRAAKCIIGKDFSLPMVNHSIVSKINIERMKQVYRQLNKYRGPSSGVLSTIPRGTLSGAYGLSNNKDVQFDTQKKIQDDKQQEQMKNKENEIVVNGYQTGEFYNYGFPQKNRGVSKEDVENQYDKYRDSTYRKIDGHPGHFQSDYHQMENHTNRFENMTDNQLICARDRLSPRACVILEEGTINNNEYNKNRDLEDKIFGNSNVFPEGDKSDFEMRNYGGEEGSYRYKDERPT